MYTGCISSILLFCSIGGRNSISCHDQRGFGGKKSLGELLHYVNTLGLDSLTVAMVPSASALSAKLPGRTAIRVSYGALEELPLCPVAARGQH